MENNNGAYDAEGIIWHQHSNKLMKKILEFFHKDISVMDLGCGHNWYVSVLRYFGYDAWGTDMVYLGSKYFVPGDLTILRPKENMNTLKINVLSLEVGEHIPADKAAVYLDNVVSFGGGDIILSWALPGQHGIGHINCQPNEWVIDQLLQRGYKLQQEKTNELREAVKYCHCNWFQNTLMYFTPCE